MTFTLLTFKTQLNDMPAVTSLSSYHSAQAIGHHLMCREN